MKIKILNVEVGECDDYDYGSNEGCIRYLDVTFNDKGQIFFGCYNTKELYLDYKNNIVTLQELNSWFNISDIVK